MTLARERDPILAGAARWSWNDPTDLLELLQRAAAGIEADDLGSGVAIPGAPGTCTSCHHAKVWHIRSRFACEQCDCLKLVKP